MNHLKQKSDVKKNISMHLLMHALSIKQKNWALFQTFITRFLANTGRLRNQTMTTLLTKLG